jgi:hypothetical protein
MKVYTGSTWVAAYASLSGALLVANNLSDLASNSSARTNLGLGTIATLSAPSGTVVGTSDSQTLTNKTLTLPIIDNIKIGYTTTATAGTTTTLTISSNYKQYFTGSTTQTIVLPVVTTLTLGHTFEIHNNSSGSLTVNSSGSNLVGTIQANTTATCTCILVTGTTAASWDFDVTGFTSALATTRGGTGLTALGTSLQVLRTNTGATALEFATLSTGTSWQSVKTSGFTAVAGEGYPCNTTSSAFTVTLPASPSVGDYVQIVDYAGTFATNNITLGANSNKINGGTANKLLTTNREAITLTYVDSTQGWVSSSGANEGTESIDPDTYSVEMLVIAGGGAGGQATTGGAGGGGAGGFRTSTQSFAVGSVYTTTVGAGGAKGTANSSTTTGQGGNGGDSSVSGSGITTITSTGGGGGGAGGANNTSGQAGKSGGSGGGTGQYGTNVGGAGNTPSTSPSQGNNGGHMQGQPYNGGGGGGGANAVGGNVTTNLDAGAGGNGLASSITGSSVTYAGGGGGGVTNPNPVKPIAGGTGGGGYGAIENGAAAAAGTANTGGGGGGGHGSPDKAGAGGSGVVILRMLTTKYSGTTTGSPTVTTDGSYKVLTYTGSGSYTA